jgi:peptidoglycan/xylan/chitin deacetylase (PgdA/CDA1 family)
LSVTLIAGATLLATAQNSSATSTNLISNPGMEISTNQTAPDNWTSNSWGANNASFSYVNTPHTGSRAVQTTITTYQDGDSKWLADPVAISSGASYSFKDWYESSTTTNLWAQYAMSNGSTSYQFLGAIPAAASWSAAIATVSPPSGATSVTVMHVLASVGSLTIDDVSLLADATCALSSVDGLVNGDFEDSCLTSAGLPAGWSTETSDPASASYAYLSSGYNSPHSVAMTDFSSQGAEVGLSTTVASVVANQRYSLSLAQSGYTYLYAYVGFTFGDGTTTYQSLMSAPATGGVWSHYADEFLTPAGVASMTVTLATSGTGTVDLDGVALTQLANQTPTTFPAGEVSLSFDDGAATAYTNGVSALLQYGFRATFYLNASTLNQRLYMTSAQVRLLAFLGQEIGSHLYDHVNMVQLSPSALQAEITKNVSALQTILGKSYPINSFASPYGAYTSGDIDTVLKYHLSHRTTDGQLNTKANLDPRQIHAVLVTSTMTAADISALATQAKNNHSWLVLVYHNISSNTSSLAAGEGTYNVLPATFRAQLAALKATGVTVAPVGTALTTLSLP